MSSKNNLKVFGGGGRFELFKAMKYYMANKRTTVAGEGGFSRLGLTRSLGLAGSSFGHGGAKLRRVTNGNRNFNASYPSGTPGRRLEHVRGHFRRLHYAYLRPGGKEEKRKRMKAMRGNGIMSTTTVKREHTPVPKLPPPLQLPVLPLPISSFKGSEAYEDEDFANSMNNLANMVTTSTQPVSTAEKLHRREDPRTAKQKRGREKRKQNRQQKDQQREAFLNRPTSSNHPA